MLLANGFMQLAAAGRRCNILHFHCLFEGKMRLVHFGKSCVTVNLNFRPHMGQYTS